VTAHCILLAALFAAWVLIAWPPLARQFAALQQWERRLAGRPMDRRPEIVDYPAFLVAEQIQKATPPGACVLFLAHTGPEHVNYYKTRFDYYLYPRRVVIHANTGAVAEGCSYLAVFRDSTANLREEPFRGHWNDEQLGQRLAALDKIRSGPHLELYGPRP